VPLGGRQRQCVANTTQYTHPRRFRASESFASELCAASIHVVVHRPLDRLFFSSKKKKKTGAIHFLGHSELMSIKKKVV
jgi:hypothetical protein